MVKFVYVLTLAPSVVGGDSGEFIATATTWGVPHPPGFPLYALILNLANYLPGDPIIVVNLVSAFFGSLAAAFLFLSLFRLTRNTFASAVGTSFFAFHDVVWSYAVTAEAFSLNNFFVCSLLFFWILFEQKRSLRTAYLIGLWSTFGLANHHIFLFLSLPIFCRVAYLVYRDRQSLKALASLGALGVLGFLPYLYLPIAYMNRPEIVWGDLSTLKGFFHHFLRKDYGTLQLAAETSSHAQTGSALLLYLGHISGWLFYIGWLPLIYGFVSNRRNPLLLMTFLLAGFYLVVFSSLSNFDLNVIAHQVMQLRFIQLVIPSLSIFLALGIFKTVQNTRWSMGRQRSLLASVALVPLILSFPTHWRKTEPAFEVFAKSIIETPEGPALILAKGDHVTNPVRALLYAGVPKPGIVFLDLEMLYYDWYNTHQQSLHKNVSFPGGRRRSSSQSGYSLLSLVDANLRQGLSVFICDGFRPLPKEFHSEFQIVPAGLCQQVQYAGRGMASRQVTERNTRLLAPLQRVNWADFGERSWEHIAQAHYLEALHFWGASMIISGEKLKDKKLVKEGIQILERFISESPFEKALVYKNLGLAYRSLGTQEPKAPETSQKYLRMFVRTTSPMDPERAKIQALLK